ncbi:MAG TPA: 16S rRNA (adenine(1518)-N(6)/adenine(1519)-N(6))-dimethyltransferase RsmA [Candidatus Paceibacterota bacterium]|jgi:16S rRNA (adenine1518-N6/adenine1519-N6)-dimethyltransferase|nr:16S rRNA (adenine(1518)-N(6)/adenine(1519)-N(6))-dimethyltransferase RsmA [Candidatus Paceibacterota bacterium]
MRLFAKKSLGQHFLNSKHVLDQIITAGNIVAGQNILEIGPGTGVLTTELLKAGACVTAVEKDDRAIILLKEKFAGEIASGHLKLIHGDVLDENLFSTNPNLPTSKSVLPSSFSSPTSPYSLIANIPYYITGAILEKFLEHEPRPQKMVLLVQKEVAERIVARPEQSTGKSKESILSVSVKVFGTPKIIAKVPPGAFTPPPTVDSAILSIENISAHGFETILKDDPEGISRFFQIVRAGFAHKRKILKRNLEATLDKTIIDAAWHSLGLDEKVRAEDISPQQWLRITEATKHIK